MSPWALSKLLSTFCFASLITYFVTSGRGHITTKKLELGKGKNICSSSLSTRLRVILLLSRCIRYKTRAFLERTKIICFITCHLKSAVKFWSMRLANKRSTWTCSSATHSNPLREWGRHAGIDYYSERMDQEEIKGERKEWRWFSCVCHRLPPDAPRLPLGRRRHYLRTRNNIGDPDTDLCLHGFGQCDKWPGDCPAKCLIGIMGWMLSCKQA